MRQRPLEFGGGPAPRPAPQPPRRQALTVSQLTERLRGLLELEFGDVWVEGEISNLSTPASGHCYFTLKDENAQLRAVVWKTHARLLRFRPKDGLKVVARGALRLYPPRGEYQLSVEVLEPLGKGSLQEAFEQLKQKLEAEGLFAAGRKRPLPLLPRRVGIVTSPTGAVIRDVVRVLRRRNAHVDLLLYPARVQGPEAAAEIAQGLRVLNELPGLDVLIVARGGGSLEDLWPFNEELVARALAASRLPTISAVGHETDVTIADFVADLRAPTPSAAAELVAAAREELLGRVTALRRQLDAAQTLRLERVRARVQALAAHRVFTAEQGRLRLLAQRLDDLERRALLALGPHARSGRERLQRLAGRLEAAAPQRRLAERRARLLAAGERLALGARARLEAARARLGRGAARLESLSPLAVLARGYALAFDAGGRLLFDADQARPGDELRLRLHSGALRARVTAKESP